MSKMDEIKQRLNKRKAASQEAMRRNFQDFYDHPLLYIALVVSGCLSMLAGIAIGLGLHIEGETVVIKADLPHIFFACLYGLLFPTFYEFALGNWLHKLLHREVDNNYQFAASVAMVVVTFCGTAITMFVASDILVTTLGFFSTFEEIPIEVQRWIAFSLPGMFMLNIFAGEVYRQSSTANVLRREASMELREKQIEADTEFELTQMDIKKNISISTAREYANSAEKDVDGIGRQKGQAAWQQDRQRMSNYNSEAPQPILRERDNHRSEEGPNS